MNTNMLGFRWFSKIFAALCLDKSILSIRRFKNNFGCAMHLGDGIPQHWKNLTSLGLEKKKFVSCIGPKKSRVGRSVKKKLHYILGQKVVFYACFTLIESWEGRKKTC